MSCEICGATDRKLIKHHTNYDPEKIQVICKSCHTKLHKNKLAPSKPKGFASELPPLPDRASRNVALYKEDADWLYVNRLPDEKIRDVMERFHRGYEELKVYRDKETS